MTRLRAGAGASESYLDTIVIYSLCADAIRQCADNAVMVVMPLISWSGSLEEMSNVQLQIVPAGVRQAGRLV
jgi:hypothetical protein